MEAYNYGYYVYFNNMTDTPKEHRNHIILKHIPDFYITSLLKLMDNIFESLTKFFVVRIFKKMMNDQI